MEVRKLSKWAYQRFADREFERHFDDCFGKDGHDYFVTFFAKEKRLFFKAVENGKTVGVVSLNIGRNVAKLGPFVVAKCSRGSGAGSMLLEKCEAAARKHKCKKIWLMTLPSMKAYGFYRKKGYVEEARLEKHWAGKHPVSVMSKFL
jgi:ribosomal protein S18 acetylase RimI-like enzyme